MSKNINILVVDDNQINRQYFSMALNKFGHSVELANNGFEAIEIAKKSNFDLIFMDIRMPDMDGYESTKKIRQYKHHLNTPILAISAEDLMEDKTHVFNGFILKPASLKTLKKTVDEFCDLNALTSNVFDKEKALKFTYNDEDILIKLISLFLKEIPSQLNLLNKSLVNKDHIDSQNIIHKFRGSCQTCGAKALDNELFILSQAIKDNDFANLDKSMCKINYNATNFINAVSKLAIIE